MRAFQHHCWNLLKMYEQIDKNWIDITQLGLVTFQFLIWKLKTLVQIFDQA